MSIPTGVSALTHPAFDLPFEGYSSLRVHQWTDGIDLQLLVEGKPVLSIPLDQAAEFGRKMIEVAE